MYCCVLFVSTSESASHYTIYSYWIVGINVRCWICPYRWYFLVGLVLHIWNITYLPKWHFVTSAFSPKINGSPVASNNIAAMASEWFILLSLSCFLIFFRILFFFHNKHQIKAHVLHNIGHRQRWMSHHILWDTHILQPQHNSIEQTQ